MRYEDWFILKDHLKDADIPVVEVGAKIEYSNFHVDIRKELHRRKYFGMDLRMGNKVDFLGDAMRMPLKSNSVGTLICVGTLEHIERFWDAVKEFHRVLKKGGKLVIATVFNFYEHSSPDYWRFTTQGMELLFKNLKFSAYAVIAEPLGQVIPIGIYGIAKK